MLESRLRTILMILSLLAALSTATGGSYYFISLQEHELAVATRQALGRTETVRDQINAHLTGYFKTTRTMAGLDELSRALSDSGAGAVGRANRILDHFQTSLGVDVCYLMNRSGLVVAASNRNDPDSFVGHNFAFRPYFKDAIRGGPGRYFALGTTSKKRGAYFSYPVYGEDRDNPLGVAVIKASISLIEDNLGRDEPGIVLLVGPLDVVFCSNTPDWLYKTLWRKSPEEKEAIARSVQYGSGPWYWAGLTQTAPDRVEDLAGREYIYFMRDIPNNPGWRVVHLRSLREISQIMLQPLARSSGFLVLGLCMLAALAVFYLNRMAREEIGRREKAEQKLRRSEERYRMLYHSTPAPMFSIDPKGRVIEVNRYFSEALGYQPDEVIGRQFTEFLSSSSAEHALTATLPDLLEKGYGREEGYQFIKKDGETVEVLLSINAEQQDRDQEDFKFLAVLTDVSTLKRTEEQLRLAQEQLSQYSKELERKVRRRTQEITSFLEYTPAVAYVKDREGRYVLVNSRWEELFGFDREFAIGLTQHEFFEKDIADQFRSNDLKVLHSGKPYQAEEKFPVGNATHTYLSVRFPVFNETGKVTRLCGISVDITDLKKAQEQLRRLSGSIMASQEKERSAIARELHDELGQMLTALRMDAVWLREHLKEPEPKARQRAARMCDLIDQTISDVRHIATRLRPPVLDDLGLVDALEWFTRDFEERTGIACVYTHFNVPILNGFQAIAAYRVAQEALTNVARHSGATDVEVTLSVKNRRLIVEVVDNGRGFNLKKVTESNTLGIAGMRERAALSGGEVSIHSLLGHGTEIKLVLPLMQTGGLV